MEKIETIKEFYKDKFNWIPENLSNEIGHFNVFRLEPCIGVNAKPITFRRRDFFKISLIIGNAKLNYADKIIEVKKQALVFSNPFIPYNWEGLENIQGGYFCIFTPSFFQNYGNLNQYDVYQPHGKPVFELSEEQFNEVTGYFLRMFQEIESDYVHKYDILRTIVFELIHLVLKIKPTTDFEKNKVDASQRISQLFLELLERQFPIDDTYQKVSLRSASDYANQLNIHVNHLNRAVKETTEKTTTQIITDRILLESKILLKHSNWNVAEIAYALGFTEATHFNNFFKKFVLMSPTKFRNV